MSPKEDTPVAGTVLKPLSGLQLRDQTKIEPAVMNGVIPGSGRRFALVKVSVKDLLRRAVYGPDDQCLQPGSCPFASNESRHEYNFATTRVTGFMTNLECTSRNLLSNQRTG
jgi:hypothetical protein